MQTPRRFTTQFKVRLDVVSRSVDLRGRVRLLRDQAKLHDGQASLDHGLVGLVERPGRPHSPTDVSGGRSQCSVQ